MKQPNFTNILGCLLFTLAGTGYATSTLANATADCHQEAQEYSIPEEERDAYINFCLASRGELIDGDTVEMDYIPPAEMDGLPDPLADDTDVAQ